MVALGGYYWKVQGRDRLNLAQISGCVFLLVEELYDNKYLTYESLSYNRLATCIVAFRVRRDFYCLVSKIRPGFALCVGSELSPKVLPCHCPRQNPDWVLAMVTAWYSHSGAIFLLTTKVLNSPPGTLSHSPPAC